MSETKLLNCPFCGGEAELIKRKSNFPYIHGVWCIGCKCRTSFEKSEEIAIEKWNNRKPVDDVLELIESEILEKLSDCGDYWYTAEKVNEAIEIIKEVLN